jgi:hypothetical protein
MANYATEIAELESILNGAVDSVSVDGTSTHIDLDAARKRLQELRAKDTLSISSGRTRPLVSKLRLGGAW